LRLLLLLLLPHCLIHIFSAAVAAAAAAHLGGCELWGDACCCKHLSSASTYYRHTNLQADTPAKQHVARQLSSTAADAATGDWKPTNHDTLKIPL
jgi:hypothetical protein